VSTDNIQVRRATSEDAPGIAKVQKQTWFETYPNAEYGITLEDLQTKDFDSPAAIDQKRAWVGGSDASHTWVATDGNEVVAFCSAKSDPGAHAVTALYVHPTQQGYGIGKQLILAALDWLGDSESVQLEAAVYNQRAIAFYESFGFVNLGPSHTTTGALPSGKIIPEIIMRRDARTRP
jgi:ribosomal protein S18 acetylase RimI-like enzyme